MDKRGENVHQLLNCIQDDVVRADDIILEEAEEIESENETPDCAQGELEMSQPGPPKKIKNR